VGPLAVSASRCQVGRPLVDYPSDGALAQAADVPLVLSRLARLCGKVASPMSAIGPPRPILRWNLMSAFGVLQTLYEASTKKHR
jgi:hypothetical protein